MRTLIPGSMILDKFYNLYTENGREKQRTKLCLCLFLLFNWPLFLKIEWFVQMTEIYLHGNSRKTNSWKNIRSIEWIWNFTHYDPYKTRNFFLIKYSLFAMFIINPFRRVIRCNKSNILKEINFRIAGSNFPKQLTSSGKLSFWITWIQTFHGSLFLQVLYFFLFFFFRCFSFFFLFIFPEWKWNESII